MFQKSATKFRAEGFKALFPYTDLCGVRKARVIHPTAVYEDPKGDLYIIMMNGRQPLSATDFFVLLHQRMLASTLVQSGKSLREEFGAYDFCDRVETQAHISCTEFSENMRNKHIAVLTKSFNMGNMDDNSIYRSPIGIKTIYAVQSDLSSKEREEVHDRYKLTVKPLLCQPHEAFMFVMDDIRRTDPAGLISIECGPTITGPLYSGSVKTARNPVDTLYLTRYQGPIRSDAVGPKFSSVSEISKTFKLESSTSEVGQDGGKWIFEQWNKL